MLPLTKFFTGGVIDKAKNYLIIALIVGVAGVAFHDLHQKNSIANLNTTITKQNGDLEKKTTEIQRLGKLVEEAKAINDQNTAELKTIQSSYAQTVARITHMNAELDKAKGKIVSLKDLINSFNKPTDDGPIAPVLGATLERINTLEQEGVAK